ncbi:hypothetical protein [Lacticaseibacillus salsurivasis]|uniref:hypothetical protein n=1 Tax=Lacticaseibacillus salsurivasis TaxID=3081441 RepID=UPI0030C6D533
MDETITKLLEAVKSNYATPIEVVVEGEASGQLNHSQSAQKLLANGHLEVRVTDTTAPDYTLSHELMHMLLITTGFPQLQYHLASGEPALDQQFFAVSMALYDAALHDLIRQWQAEHGVLTAEVMTALAAGVEAVLPAVDELNDGLLVYCTMTLLDALVMFEGGSKAQQKHWSHDYPQAMTLAQSLYATITSKKHATPFDFRRLVVRLWRQFDEMLPHAGFQPTVNAEFATLPPVLSERQLRLAVNQTYELLHSEMRDLETKKRAYVAMGKGDGQNAFVLPVGDLSPEGFQQLYQAPLKTILNQYDIDYAIRD